MAAGEVTQGRRLSDGFHMFDSEPGDYWRQSRGTTGDPGSYSKLSVDFDWCIRDPYGSLGTISKHSIEVHEDGTITVTPSILDATPYAQYTGDELRAMGVTSIISDSKAGWHGFLERGVWRQV